MADPSSRRKLAAILSADVVGYSRLMAANEAATVETLKSYRDIIARLVARRGGRVVNAPGDALLAEFPSAVEAVQAAIEIQKSVEGHNSNSKRTGACSSALGSIWAMSSKSPTAQSMGTASTSPRVWRHSPRAVVSGSPPPFTTPSRKAFLRFRVPRATHQVKNIAKPVRVYRVRGEPKSPPARAWPKRPTRWQIAVPALVLILLLLGAAGAWKAVISSGLAVSGKSFYCGPAVQEHRRRFRSGTALPMDY